MSVQEVVQGCCTSSKHHVCVRLRDNMLLKLSKDVFFLFDAFIFIFNLKEVKVSDNDEEKTEPRRQNVQINECVF